MNQPENSADKGAGSGCMARLVRCSSFFGGSIGILRLLGDERIESQDHNNAPKYDIQ
jgi:hypothetical protein